MIKQFVVCALIASALVCLASADEVANADANVKPIEEQKTAEKNIAQAPIENGTKEQLLDLGIITSKGLKNTYDDVKPTLNSLGRTLSEKLKQGYSYLDGNKRFNYVSNRVVPVVKRLEPIVSKASQYVDAQVTRAKPPLQKVVSDIMSEHDRRQAYLKQQSQENSQTNN